MKTKDLLKTKLSSLAGPPLRQPRPLDERLRPARRQPDDHDDRDGRQSGIRLRRPQATVETFTQVPDYTVTFQADGATVKTMTVEDGYTLKDSDYPAVPTKTGYTGEWVKYTLAVHSNVTVSATYTKDVVTYTVTFVADGVTVKTMTVEDGYTLKDFDYPTVPSKTGYNGMWKKYTSAIHKNVTVYAIYRALTTAKHTVKFVARLEVVKTMTVSDGYTLQSSDYPTVPPREGYRGTWERYSSPVYEDITINAVYHKLGDIIPTQPTDPDEIMSGGEGEPVEADAPAEDETVSPQGTHVTGTQTVTHEYLTLNGKVARETIKTNNTLTAVLDFIYDESGKPFALKYSTDGATFDTYYYVLNLQGDVVKLIQESGGVVARYTYDAWGNILDSGGNLAAINPLRYRGYYYDNETGFYYLQSRYYDPQNRRFINADSYASTGQGFVGTNMFAYCNNSPILFVDHDGDDAEAVGWWASTMWWLCAADGPIPVGDALYGLGIIVFGGISIYTASNFSFEVDLPKEHSSPCEAEEETEVPEVTYPGDDPAEAPDGTSWRGSGPQGSKEGNYYNQETGESWHPDLDHPDPIGPHWDYRDRAGAWWRIGKGNIITPK